MSLWGEADREIEQGSLCTWEPTHCVYVWGHRNSSARSPRGQAPCAQCPWAFLHVLQLSVHYQSACHFGELEARKLNTSTSGRSRLELGSPLGRCQLGIAGKGSEAHGGLFSEWTPDASLGHGQCPSWARLRMHQSLSRPLARSAVTQLFLSPAGPTITAGPQRTARPPCTTPTQRTPQISRLQTSRSHAETRTPPQPEKTHSGHGPAAPQTQRLSRERPRSVNERMDGREKNRRCLPSPGKETTKVTSFSSTFIMLIARTLTRTKSHYSFMVFD